MKTKEKRILQEAIAINLIRFREYFGLSQLQLAERSGLSRQYISMVERQMRMPHFDTWIQICRGLNVNERDFMLAIQVYSTSPEFSTIGFRPPPTVPFLATVKAQAIQARLNEACPMRMEEV